MDTCKCLSVSVKRLSIKSTTNLFSSQDPSFLASMRSC